MQMVNDCKIDGFGAMGLKSEYVKKAQFDNTPENCLIQLIRKQNYI